MFQAARVFQNVSVNMFDVNSRNTALEVYIPTVAPKDKTHSREKALTLKNSLHKRLYLSTYLFSRRGSFPNRIY